MYSFCLAFRHIYNCIVDLEKCFYANRVYLIFAIFRVNYLKTYAIFSKSRHFLFHFFIGLSSKKANQLRGIRISRSFAAPTIESAMFWREI